VTPGTLRTYTMCQWIDKEGENKQNVSTSCSDALSLPSSALGVRCNNTSVESLSRGRIDPKMMIARNSCTRR